MQLCKSVLSCSQQLFVQSGRQSCAFGILVIETLEHCRCVLEIAGWIPFRVRVLSAPLYLVLELPTVGATGEDLVYLLFLLLTDLYLLVWWVLSGLTWQRVVWVFAQLVGGKRCRALLQLRDPQSVSACCSPFKDFVVLLGNKEQELVARSACSLRLLQDHYTVAYVEIGLPAMAVGLPSLPLLCLGDHRICVVDISLDPTYSLLGILAIDLLS